MSIHYLYKLTFYLTGQANIPTNNLYSKLLLARVLNISSQGKDFSFYPKKHFHRATPFQGSCFAIRFGSCDKTSLEKSGHVRLIIEHVAIMCDLIASLSFSFLITHMLSWQAWTAAFLLNYAHSLCRLERSFLHMGSGAELQYKHALGSDELNKNHQIQ